MKKQERHKAVPAIYLILKKGKDVLLIRRINTGYYDGYYSVPAGHIEAGELPIDALLREVEEEIGLIVVRDSVTLAHTMYRTRHDSTGDRVDFFFFATKYTGEIENKEPHKCDDIAWFPINRLPVNLMQCVRDALEAIKRGKNYSEFGLDKIVSNPNG